MNRGDSMGRKRRPPPLWWLLGYVAQYQPQALLEQCAAMGVDHATLYAASEAAAFAGYPKPGPFNRAVREGGVSAQYTPFCSTLNNLSITLYTGKPLPEDCLPHNIHPFGAPCGFRLGPG